MRYCYWRCVVLCDGDFLLAIQCLASSQGVKVMASESGEQRAYSTRHMWALADVSTKRATIGMTDYLAEALGAIRSIDMPQVDDEIDMDTFCIHLHLARRIHHLRSPLSGRILEINEDVLDNPGLLHLNAESNWLYKMEFDDADELELLMDSGRYARFVDQL